MKADPPRQRNESDADYAMRVRVNRFAEQRSPQPERGHSRYLDENGKWVVGTKPGEQSP